MNEYFPLSFKVYVHVQVFLDKMTLKMMLYQIQVSLLLPSQLNLFSMPCLFLMFWKEQEFDSCNSCSEASVKIGLFKLTRLLLV